MNKPMSTDSNFPLKDLISRNVFRRIHANQMKPGKKMKSWPLLSALLCCASVLANAENGLSLNWTNNRLTIFGPTLPVRKTGGLVSGSLLPQRLDRSRLEQDGFAAQDT